MFDSHRKSTPGRDFRGRHAPLLRRLPKLGLLASAFLAVVIAVLTLWPAPEPGEGRIFSIDKLYHFVAWAALVFPAIATGPRRWAWVVPAAIVFGGAIELIQPFVNRTGLWSDFIADIAGALVGLWLGRKAHRWLKARFALPGH
jgi:VanZ family protein